MILLIAQMIIIYSILKEPEKTIKKKKLVINDNRRLKNSMNKFDGLLSLKQSKKIGKNNFSYIPQFVGISFYFLDLFNKFLYTRKNNNLFCVNVL